jgi:CDP-diacylglycerol--glycerol-3-phosphate 3-phosphatidyltransferase
MVRRAAAGHIRGRGDTWAANLPNLVTLSRFLLGALFAAVFFLPLNAYVLVAVTLAIEASDVLDGLFARRLGTVSDTGAMLDSSSDDFARLTQFFCLLSVELVPLWFVLIVFWRDVLVTLLRMLALASTGAYIHARFSGKWKGITQGAMLVLFVSYYAAGRQSDAFTDALLTVAALVTISSLVDYGSAYAGLVRRLVFSAERASDYDVPRST